MNHRLSRFFCLIVLILGVGNVNSAAIENQPARVALKVLVPGPKVNCSPHEAPAEPFDPCVQAAVTVTFVNTTNNFAACYGPGDLHSRVSATKYFSTAGPGVAGWCRRKKRQKTRQRRRHRRVAGFSIQCRFRGIVGKTVYGIVSLRANAASTARMGRMQSFFLIVERV